MQKLPCSRQNCAGL